MYILPMELNKIIKEKKEEEALKAKCYNMVSDVLIIVKEKVSNDDYRLEGDCFTVTINSKDFDRYFELTDRKNIPFIESKLNEIGYDYKILDEDGLKKEYHNIKISWNYEEI